MLLVLLAARPASAAPGTSIQGVVVETGTREPLVGVSCVVVGTGLGTLTDRATALLVS